MSSDYTPLLKGREFHSSPTLSSPGPSSLPANTSPLVPWPGLLVQAGLQVEVGSATQPCHHYLYQA